MLLPLEPYVPQRAEEIQATDPKVAYYCRVYALDQVSTRMLFCLVVVTSHTCCVQGIKIQNRAKEISQLLGSVMSKLEKDKPLVGIDASSDRYYCEQFALTVFKRAEKMDRAGLADMNTSIAFYASAIFIDVSNLPQLVLLPLDLHCATANTTTFKQEYNRNFGGVLL
jgi:vacuolar protein sorting-associated protein VTA1